LIIFATKAPKHEKFTKNLVGFSVFEFYGIAIPMGVAGFLYII